MRASLVVVLAAGVLISGCVPPQNSTTDTPTDKANQAAPLIEKACSYKPIVDSLIAIFAKGVPELSTVQSVVTAVCKAVEQSNVVGARSIPTVGGVPVRGQYLR